VRRTTQFKQMVTDDEILVVPSAYDALSAKVIAQAGFKAVHMTGSGTSASLLGYPDLGFTTISEMATHAKNLALAVDVPVIVDADTGYGNALNVMRTVREFEQAGVVGMHIEDQATPKRCGHLEGKELISAEEMVGKIGAAVEARGDPDFMLIARTDAREIYGLQEAIRRANAYVDAGADCIFVEAPLSVAEMGEIATSVKAPLLANMVEGGRTPWLGANELQEIGFSLVIYPLSGWMAAAATLRELMRELKDTGTTQGFWDRMSLHMTFEELFEVFDYSKISEFERRYVPDGSSEPGGGGPD
jgi:carboxyvinyl-carboxyphosphonate phosphorylmutase